MNSADIPPEPVEPIEAAAEIVHVDRTRREAVYVIKFMVRLRKTLL